MNYRSAKFKIEESVSTSAMVSKFTFGSEMCTCVLILIVNVENNEHWTLRATSIPDISILNPGGIRNMREAYICFELV